MARAKEVTVSKSIPLDERVHTVGRQLREWIQSLDTPVDPENNALRLIGTTRRNKDFVYRYRILDDQGGRRRT
jgi:hypothetical protein